VQQVKGGALFAVPCTSKVMLMGMIDYKKIKSTLT
jgi:hypothetical protein